MRFFLFAAALALASPAAGQGEDLRATAERFVRSEATQDMMDQMMAPETVDAALRSQFGDQIPDETRRQIVEIVVEEIGAIRPDMEAAMIDAAAETFTIEELEAQIAFQQTPEGASAMSKQQAFMESYLQAVGPQFQAANERAMRRAQETMQGR